MKRNKVLLGLFVGLMTLVGGVSNAQSESKFYEIGPMNAAGQVSSLVADLRDTSRTTLYAGAMSGGLFMRSERKDVIAQLYTSLGYSQDEAAALADTTIWHKVTYIKDGREVVLPISCMVQGSDGAIYIGTGDAYRTGGSNYSARLGSTGKGLFRFDPASGEFLMLAESDGSDFWAINDLDYISYGGKEFLYVATPLGLYRYETTTSSQWSSAIPNLVRDGAVDEITIIRALRTAYITSPGNVSKIGDVTLDIDAIGSRIVNITSSNTAFVSSLRVRIAVAPSDPSYVYAMVIGPNGIMENVYLCTDGQHWLPLATSTVTPFVINSGINAGTIAVDPGNPSRVIVAGDLIWVGQGYVPGALYQWTTSSSDELTLMAISPDGDYMSNVIGSYSFVHSGIHQIVPVYYVRKSGDLGDTLTYAYHTYYIATDGGIYAGGDAFSFYANMNQGLNNTEINSVAVCPDGTIVSGAASNASPVIEPILAHFGGQPRISWFDDGSLGNINHDANLIWRAGNGGAVAASAFQQYAPQSRRTIFTSTANGALARTYADYMGYNNPTTWTSGSSFVTDEIVGGPAIGVYSLWETDNNSIFQSYVTQAVDTLGYILRPNGGEWDTVWVNDTIHGDNRGSKFRIQRNDKAIFHSRAHGDYPFEYTFRSAQLAKDSVRVVNPIQSRMVTIGDRLDSRSESSLRAVWYSWQPTDFTKVWDSTEYYDALRTSNSAALDRLQLWSPIFGIQRIEGTSTESLYPRNAVIGNDGLVVYVSAFDTKTHQSMLFRLTGFENVDFSESNYNIKMALSIDRGSRSAIKVDTFKVDGSYYFPRPISSLSVDPNPSRDRLIITFDDYNDNYANVAYIDNPKANWTTITPIATENSAITPAYCALVEDSTGIIYVGTEHGVYTKDGSASWQLYENIPDVPVTAMCQQTKKLPVRRNLTHTGIAANNYVFAKTKWPRAIYFGTYGRGIFMDMTYVTDMENEIVDPSDYEPANIPTVNGSGLNSVSLYPNPVYNEANITITSAVAGNAQLRVYDLNGRCVIDRQLGHASEGENLYTLQTQGLSKGMYLINVIIGGHTAATKMMVR